MNERIVIEPLTAEAFQPFGDVLTVEGEPSYLINQGLCGRYHDLAHLDFVGTDARAGISLFKAEPRSLPYTLDMMERHPFGSQAFLPMTADPFLIIVADDAGARPARPRAFLSKPGQGVNYFRNTWHGVLTPLTGSGLFAVVDRIGSGGNLEEFWFDDPYIIEKTECETAEGTADTA